MLPLLPLLGLLGIFAIGGFIYKFHYLDKKSAKKRINEQEYRNDEQTQLFSELIRENYNKGNFNECDIDLKANEETTLLDINKIYTSADRYEIIDILVNRYGYEKGILLRESTYNLLNLLENHEVQEGSIYNDTDDEMLEYIDDETILFDWIIEDEDSNRIFAGSYYDGNVISMEEFEADEIDDELQYELDNQQIVIL